ncbi:hypothetical protein ACFOPQ_19950, partial [Deinococcus antarcticus]
SAYGLTGATSLAPLSAFWGSLHQFPPYTPELSPAEPLVGQVKRPVASRTFKSLDEVEEVLSQECQRLMANPSVVRSLTFFPWIRHVLNSI